jgi:GNAT superfamily N-acetyltransferase
MGLVESVRGRGFGLQVVRHAQWLCRQEGRDRLVLAVDRRNAPARRIYMSCGFWRWDERQVLLRSF